MKNIRNYYSELGVKAFYEANGKDYQNPHFPQIAELLQNNTHRIDYSNVLDFCCGSGEVTQVLAEMGFPNSIGSDPFTQEAFERNTGKTCNHWNFDDVVKGALEGKKFSAVICSFAMHLCEKEKQFPLVYQLFQTSPQIIILTPHKRPALELLDGVKLDFEDDAFTEKGKKVRMKAYQFRP